MSIMTLIALAQLAQTLYAQGKVVAGDIKAALGQQGLSDEEMNKVLLWVENDAAFRQARREAEANPT